MCVWTPHLGIVSQITVMIIAAVITYLSRVSVSDKSSSLYYPISGRSCIYSPCCQQFATCKLYSVLLTGTVVVMRYEGVFQCSLHWFQSAA